MTSVASIKSITPLLNVQHHKTAWVQVAFPRVSKELHKRVKHPRRDMSRRVDRRLCTHSSHPKSCLKISTQRRLLMQPRRSCCILGYRAASMFFTQHNTTSSSLSNPSQHVHFVLKVSEHSWLAQPQKHLPRAAFHDISLPVSAELKAHARCDDLAMRPGKRFATTGPFHSGVGAAT